FDTSDRDIKTIQPIIERINSYEAALSELTDAELKAKTPEFKGRLANGESLDSILPEAYAVVRETSLRLLGMRQFDVQMVGGIVLHHGRISEMKTGEGKTLVAVAPMYLNALSGKGAHLVTVNDYLARRDATWMGPIYDFLGLTVGVVQGQSVESDERGGSYRYSHGSDVLEDPRYVNLEPCSRREAYLCDITYGTNHEFGFDYLRDNMAFQVEQLSMRELNYAIVDEVDSILIDEARTPHIISGPSSTDVSLYSQIDKVVQQLTQGEKDDSEVPGVHFVVDKKNHNATLTEEGMDLVETLMGIENIAHDPKLFHHVNAAIKAHGLFQKDVEYVVRSGEVVIVDENTGRMMFGRRFSDGLHQALEAKENVKVQPESQTVAVITFQNLFRMYEKLAGMTGTAKTEEDEFRKIYGLDVVSVPTNRPMTRVDREDAVFKTQEAKFRAMAHEILRLWTKQQPVLVGTRSIEMSEMVSARLTSDMLQKTLLAYRLYEVKEVKGTDKETKKLIDDLAAMPFEEINNQILSTICSKAGISGDALNEGNLDWFLKKHQLPEENKEFLVEALKHGAPHNVLNAKFHEKEAVIVSEAGRKGAITIATNMAGRGVDILLGGRVSDAIIEKARETDDEADEVSFDPDYADTFQHFRRGGLERAAPPLPLDDQERRGLAEAVRALGGLYILGTERHESRRIDNQLRGRAGRQGDPGESKFFVSLEDHLWKIFNAKLLENPLLKTWPAMEEINAGFLTKAIQKTQERIENHFFEARKHVLEYDDVLNSQREHIYGMRRDFLLGDEAGAELKEGLKEVVADAVKAGWVLEEDGSQVYDSEEVFERLNETMPIVDFVSPAELDDFEPDALQAFLEEKALDAYMAKQASFGDDGAVVERQIMLQAVNDKWMDHLQLIDYIREGINLRAYGQVDPLVAYKRETFDLFTHTLSGIRDQGVKYFFRAMPMSQPPAEFEIGDPALDDVLNRDSGMILEGEVVSHEPGGWPEEVSPSNVGRNDACPCGSGRKFKQCHYPIFRENGLI
ncbi:MAG: SEC-C domain-containing protein, partial [Fimbriimonadaceae bacterium]|nr:SEC-C domain-containing protein [Fimbriimonadaceae bacterium]